MNYFVPSPCNSVMTRVFRATVIPSESSDHVQQCQWASALDRELFSRMRRRVDVQPTWGSSFLSLFQKKTRQDHPSAVRRSDGFRVETWVLALVCPRTQYVSVQTSGHPTWQKRAPSPRTHECQFTREHVPSHQNVHAGRAGGVCWYTVAAVPAQKE